MVHLFTYYESICRNLVVTSRANHTIESVPQVLPTVNK